MLKLAALLHDIGKPLTKSIEADGRTRFLGHALEGAAMATERLEVLRFSNKETKLIETEILHHLRPMQLSQEGLPTKRAIYRYFRDTGDAGIDILFLSLADHLATRGPNLDMAGWREHTKLTEYLLNQRLQEENITRPVKLVDGSDLINIFGLSPGPKIREILEAVREAQAAGEINSREEALAYISSHLLTRAE
jgi:poly(A) polymerase